MKNYNKKLQNKLISFIIFGMLIGFSVFLYINYLLMYKATTIEIEEKLKNKSSNLTQSIQEWLDDKQRMAIALANRAVKIKNRTPEHVRTYLQLVNESANIDASMIYYKGQNLIHTQLDWKQSPKQEELNMPYQTMLKEGFKPTISKVFKSPINKMDNMIAVIAPFEKDSLATLVVEIRDIEDRVSQTRFNGGYSVLVDANKKILVHQNTKFQGKKISTVFPKLKWLEDEMFSTESGLTQYNKNDKEFIVLFDTIKPTKWKMLLILEKKTAFARLNAQTLKILFVSLCFFIVGTIFIIIINIFYNYWLKKVEKEKDEYEFLLIRRSKMNQMGELVSGINHQLHQPLNSLNLLLTSILSRLKNKTLTPAITEESLITSQKVILMMSDIIYTFKNFYKINENISKFCLNPSIDNVLKIIHVDFSKKNIGIEISNDIDKKFNVISIENFIQQVLLVLLQNAKEALNTMQKKENIKIKIFLKNDLVCIDICDNGEGIGKNLEAKLFDSVKSSKKNSGSGLGLYFAKKLAQEKLQGDIILIKSSNPTIFRFSFNKDLGKAHAVKNS